MSGFEDNYDSDSEYVTDYNLMDLGQFQLCRGTKLVGGSWGAVLEHCSDDDINFQFALPPIEVGDSLDITEASKNGFLRIKLNMDDSNHIEFKQWVDSLDNWLVQQFVSNHNEWFGHMWQSGGPLEGRPIPPDSAIRDMYHPMLDDENIFCSRVHVRRGTYDIQCMDSEQQTIGFESIKNCKVVPLVELKGIFMKPRGYNPDIVLRGLVMVTDEDDETETTEYCLFHSPDEEQPMAYYDYCTATEDEESDIDDDEAPVIENTAGNDSPPAASDLPQSVSNAEVTPSSNVVEEDKNNVKSESRVMSEAEIREFMQVTENAKRAAKDAEDMYQRYMANQTSSN
tara:strand:- start:20847 stop:21869 length:1023 start_codon:yes stop_codon:yes gene_type:complete